MKKDFKNIDVIIIGAGASGLMCAIEASKRGRKVVVIEHANKAGKKILMSGGGRCNFTNYYISPEKFQSANPHFCKSALSRYTQWDFIAWVESQAVAYHEKTLGQLFCNDKAKVLLQALLQTCEQQQVKIYLNTEVSSYQKSNTGFHITTSRDNYSCQSLVVATGGLSIPTLGASGFGYEIAKYFGHAVEARTAALVPFTLTDKQSEKYKALAGISVEATVQNSRISFKEALLFTHRGISGPAILQISAYWHSGESVTIDLLPDLDLYHYLLEKKQNQPKLQLKTCLENHLPKRLVDVFISQQNATQKLGDCKHEILDDISKTFKSWTLKPAGTEGYRTAEVTKGGVDCSELSSKTLESQKVAGLYFIGEVVDVTGWLGGYNFQWAWSSGWAAGQVV
jgi:predicted Rossmann fold flavoprotein